MRKLRLDTDALVVDSFAAVSQDMERCGTVRGNGMLDMITVRVTCYTLCGDDTCAATGNPCAAC